MALIGDDCYFFYYSTCAKGPGCPYRHSTPALGKEEVCPQWAKGSCAVPSCPRRHMVIQKDRGTIQCYWESQPSGCQKAHCPFMHTKPRPTSAQPVKSNGPATATKAVHATPAGPTKPDVVPSAKAPPAHRSVQPPKPKQASNESDVKFIPPTSHKSLLASSPISASPVMQHHQQPTRRRKAQSVTVVVPDVALPSANRNQTVVVNRAAMGGIRVRMDCNNKQAPIVIDVEPKNLCNHGNAGVSRRQTRTQGQVSNSTNTRQLSDNRADAFGRRVPAHPAAPANTTVVNGRANAQLRCQVSQNPSSQHAGHDEHRPRPLMPTPEKRFALEDRNGSEPKQPRRDAGDKHSPASINVQSLQEILCAKNPNRTPASHRLGAQAQSTLQDQTPAPAAAAGGKQGLSLKELRAQRFARKATPSPSMQQQPKTSGLLPLPKTAPGARQQPKTTRTAQQQQRNNVTTVQAQKPAAVSATAETKEKKKPMLSSVSAASSNGSGLRVKSLQEIRAEKRKHQQTQEDDKPAVARAAVVRQSIPKLQKTTPAATCKPVLRPVLQKAEASQAQTQEPPAVRRRLSRSEEKSKASAANTDPATSVTTSVTPSGMKLAISTCTPASLSVTPSEGPSKKSSSRPVTPAKRMRSLSGSRNKLDSSTATSVSSAMEELKQPPVSIDDIDFMDDAAFEKAMKDLVGDISYSGDDGEGYDFDGTINDDDLLLDAETLAHS